MTRQPSWSPQLQPETRPPSWSPQPVSRQPSWSPQPCFTVPMRSVSPSPSRALIPGTVWRSVTPPRCQGCVPAPLGAALPSWSYSAHRTPPPMPSSGAASAPGALVSSVPRPLSHAMGHMMASAQRRTLAETDAIAAAELGQVRVSQCALAPEPVTSQLRFAQAVAIHSRHATAGSPCGPPSQSSYLGSVPAPVSCESPCAVAGSARAPSQEPMPKADSAEGFGSSTPSRPPKCGAGPLPQALSVKCRQSMSFTSAEELYSERLPLGERLRQALQPGGNAVRQQGPMIGHGPAGPDNSGHCSMSSAMPGNMPSSARSVPQSLATEEVAKSSGLQDPSPQPRPRPLAPREANPARLAAPLLACGSTPALTTSVSRPLVQPVSMHSQLQAMSLSTSEALPPATLCSEEDDDLTRRLYARFGLASCGVSLETFAQMHRSRLASMPFKAGPPSQIQSAPCGGA